MDGGRIQSASSIEEQSTALRNYVKDAWTCKGVAIQATGRRCFTVSLPQEMQNFDEFIAGKFACPSVFFAPTLSARQSHPKILHTSRHFVSILGVPFQCGHLGKHFARRARAPLKSCTRPDTFEAPTLLGAPGPS